MTTTLRHAVKLQLVVAHDLPKLWDVKGGQPRAAGNENAFRCLAAGKFIFFILPDREVVGVPLFQAHEHVIHSIFEVVIVLFYFHAV